MSDGYHQDFSAVSKTMLSLFIKSRLEYFHTYVTRQMQPRAVGRPALVGSVLHAILLEDRCLDDLVQLWPAEVLNVNGGLIAARCKPLEAENPSVNFLKAAEYEAIAVTAAAVLAADGIGEVIEQATCKEQPFYATVHGLPCKCKPDILCDMGDKLIAYDLKFMEEVDPSSWRRSARRFTYWMQDAHYSAVLEEQFKKPVQFRFCVIETKFPYRVQWKWYDPMSRSTARDEHRRIIGDLGDCYESREWGDDWDSIMVLEPWEVEIENDNAEVQI